MPERNRDLFDGLEGQVERDRALVQVSGNAGDGFVAAGLDAIYDIPLGTRITGEGIRYRLEALGIKPHHHNAWGALVMTAVRRKWLVKTGEHAKMTDPKSHARETKVYIRQ